MAHGKRSDAQKILHEQRKARAIELRIRSWSYRKIAADIGISFQHVGNLISEGLAELRELNGQKAEDLRDIYRDQLTEANERIDAAVQQGDLNAIATRLKLNESLRRLDGLDAPKKEEKGLNKEDRDAIDTLSARFSEIAQRLEK